jgi:hypothetical protein
VKFGCDRATFAPYDFGIMPTSWSLPDNARYFDGRNGADVRYSLCSAHAAVMKATGVTP